MSRAFVTSHSVAGTPPAFSPEDVAEHEDRIGRLRALMDEHGFDAVIANDVGAPGAYPAYARYLSNFTIGRPGHVIAVVPRATMMASSDWRSSDRGSATWCRSRCPRDCRTRPRSPHHRR